MYQNNIVNGESPSQERNQAGEILAIRDVDDDDDDGDDNDNDNDNDDDDDDDDDGSTGYTGYKPAGLEQYFMENMGTLGLNWTISGYSAYTCHIFTAPHVTNQDIFDDIRSYTKDLDQYSEAIQTQDVFTNESLIDNNFNDYSIEKIISYV
jgi:hypothetical protein